VSEYQYYEFPAIDRPLCGADMRWLRSLSTRARITPKRFVNTYRWGGFKGDPVKLMTRCLDAFVYFANFGYCRFMLRLPAGSISLKQTRAYCRGRSPRPVKARGCVLLEFVCDGEGENWDPADNGSGWMASGVPLRGVWLGGDGRCLYPAWLLHVQSEALGERTPEPPVLPGLNERTGPLMALADFRRIDRTLIDVAAERSGPGGTTAFSGVQLRAVLRKLPASGKGRLLIQVLRKEDRVDRQRVLNGLGGRMVADNPLSRARRTVPLRTVGELFAEWDGRGRNT